MGRTARGAPASGTSVSGGSISPVSTCSNPNDVAQMGAGLAGALGGTANQGYGDINAAAGAYAGAVPTQIPMSQTTNGQQMMSSGGGGSSGYRFNPFTAAATIQRMTQAEEMFGPKVMAQYLKNQGYSINNASDYQDAWMKSALFGPKYQYQKLRN